MTYRPLYDEKLASIQSDVLRMAGVAGDMVRIAGDAALNGDTDAAHRVVKMDDEVDGLEKAILSEAVICVARETPVGSDLRMLISTLGIVGEIEKVADDAVKLARRANKLSGHFPGEMKVALMELGEAARKAFSSSMRLFTHYDGALAEEVIRSDEVIDGQYVSARNRVLELIQEDPTQTDHLVRTIDAFHALEHVADHAVEIACRLRLHHTGQT